MKERMTERYVHCELSFVISKQVVEVERHGEGEDYFVRDWKCQ